jgi:hypothetical protein
LNFAFRVESAVNKTPFFISPKAADDCLEVLSGRALVVTDDGGDIEFEEVEVEVAADMGEWQTLSTGLS